MCVREEIKMMKSQELNQEGNIRGERGSIVNIASQLGLVGKANNRMSLFTSFSNTDKCEC